ncbi:glycosyltransferase [[Eubacterium] cellulosolvens]
MSYAWESGNTIKRKIENFLNQDYPKDKIEIIIYDNCSTDETSAICQDYQKKGLIKYYRPKRSYDRKSPVLDDAIKKIATGDILVLTDPDGVCERSWIKKLVQPFSDPKVGAAAGITHCGNWYKNMFTKLRAIEDEWWNNIAFTGRDGKIRITNFQPVCGCNYALRRNTWKDLGSTHGESLLEDLVLSLNLHDKGWKVAVTDANVWQEEAENIRQYVRQRKRWYSFKSFELLRKKKRFDRLVGLLPQAMQISAIFSLFMLIGIIIKNSLLTNIDVTNMIFAASPFVFHNIALVWGILKSKKIKLLPYFPIFLTFDALLQLWCFIEIRINSKKEQEWVKVSGEKYYHIGTEIRMD